MQTITRDPNLLPGWGIDADPDNDPTYPMRQRTPEDHDGYSWVRPTQQPITVEVLHSNERPNVSAVFGTSSPPSGLSGIIRRFAFNYSENSYLHWLPLLFADRVNVVEGIVEDLAHGKVPNIWAEKGYKAQWKYDRVGMLEKIAAAALVTTAAVFVLSRKSAPKKHSRSAR
ncbi:hypothetical protein [Hymenobacter baengnokdamensis]|uniref:hypothetical protein n=1 Tax=Hymenobacter baengnokdamensis TaxID=2615203 RepID=UPI001245AB80|nr:hypothetical protein [Hymenobacter baengnokdamensis]